MSFEVEQKFAVADPQALEARLRALGAGLSPPQLEVDTYFAHPGRDFATTDEALRIRRRGEAVLLTYKGPKIDETTKTRREIEIELSGDAAAADIAAELLSALGFRPVAIVRKRRRATWLESNGWQIQVLMDDVQGLGHYAELETLADEPRLDDARAAIAEVADSLSLGWNERRSYLELLQST